MPNLFTSPTPTTDVAPPATPVKVTTALVWLTTGAIFCQAIIAGQFVSQDGKDGWITVHGVVADASWVLSLVTAGYAFLTLRRHSRCSSGWRLSCSPSRSCRRASAI